MSLPYYNIACDATYPNLLEDRIRSAKNLSCNRSFVEAIESCFGHRPLNILDLGCFQGSLVQEFLSRGHLAVGIELCPQKGGFWKDLYGKHLFACNVSHPFSVLVKEGQNFRDQKDTPEIQVMDGNEIPFQHRLLPFDVIIGINLAQLINPEALPIFFMNIRKHLKIGGLFIGSISLEDHVPENNEIMKWQNNRLRFIEGLDFVNYPFESIPYPIFCSFYYGLVRKF